MRNQLNTNTVNRRPKINIVALIGNVATKPELSYSAGGKALCEFRISVCRTTGEDKADYFKVVTFGRQAEICSEYLSVGRRISVEGRLRHITWAEGGGVEIVSDRVRLLGGSRQESESKALT